MGDEADRIIEDGFYDLLERDDPAYDNDIYTTCKYCNKTQLHMDIFLIKCGTNNVLS